LFVDRVGELEWLERRWRSGRAELLLVYGRRRIGKTRLVKEWLRGRSGIVYFYAEEEPEQRLLERLSMEIARATGDELVAERPFTSWRQVFLYISRLASSQRFGLVIDEFQYAASSSPTLLSTLQHMWDERLSDTQAFILLMGSLVSFTGGILSSRSPLYGRFTGILRLAPLSPFHIHCFVPSWPPEDVVRLYAVFGGIPGYLVEVDPVESLWENVRRLILSPDARFLDEAKHLLREELREVTRYYAVLEAIASGATSYAEIASKSGVPVESLSKYLRVLEDMGLVARETPVVGRGRPRYRLLDPFLRFWFRYIPRHRTAIELGLTSAVVESVRRDFEASLAPLAWEEMLPHTVALMAGRGLLPLKPSRMGRWWHRGVEIDLVAVGEDEEGEGQTLLVAEAKWSNLTAAEARRLLDSLRAKAQHIPVKPQKTFYMLLAKHVEGSVSTLPDELVVTLDDLEAMWRGESCTPHS
jgi:AAA+ ATPase superfamily predicted ATPase